MWYVGQKVVCINDSPFPSDEDIKWGETEAIYIDEIYTLKSIHHDLDGALVFHLFEVERDRESRDQFSHLVGYGTWRFRPLLNKKTDISVFTDILKTVKDSENV